MKQVSSLYPDREKDLVNDKTSVPILAINYRRNIFFFSKIYSRLATLRKLTGNQTDFPCYTELQFDENLLQTCGQVVLLVNKTATTLTKRRLFGHFTSEVSTL